MAFNSPLDYLNSEIVQVSPPKCNICALMCGLACACPCHHVVISNEVNLPGGSPDATHSSNCDNLLSCTDCMTTFKLQRNLTAHKKFYCAKTKGLDHLVSSSRQALGKPTDKDIEEKDLNSTTYKVDQEMAPFLETVPSAYSRFRMCENPRNPQPLPGFWPCLFDYRGKETLKPVEDHINARNAYKTLASILTDGYIYHNVDKITVKKQAFVEQNGQIYEITNFRCPRSHCTINEGARVRLDQPRFKTTETDSEVTISLHERYLELLPRYALTAPDEKGEKEEEKEEDEENEDEEKEDEEKEDEEKEEGEEEMEVVDEENQSDDTDEYLGMSSIFQPDDEEEEMSQELSQISLDDCQGFSSSPITKKRRITDSGKCDGQFVGSIGSSLAGQVVGTIETSLAVSCAPESSASAKHEEFGCKWCKLFVGKDVRDVNRHIQKSCPENPDIDALEAARRRNSVWFKKMCVKKAKHEAEPDHIQKEECKDEPDKEDIGGADQGCSSHSDPVISYAHGHRRLPRNQPGPLLNPDPDTLHPRLLRQIIPVIQAINSRQFTNRQNRWIAGLGQPRNPVNIRNTHWPRVITKGQLPFMLSETEFMDLYYFTPQQVFQFRNAIIYPMLNDRAAQAQGARGARSSLPHTLTPDSLAVLFFGKVRLNLKDRVVASGLGIHHKHVEKWLRILRDYYFTHDTFIQRNVNLSNRANLQAVLRQGAAATARCPRTSAIYGHLCRPNTDLVVVAIDSRAVKIQKSTDPHLQKRSISTKIHDNALQKMTISDMSGLPLCTFALMCSISPAGTDESNCEHLITIHEAGVPGGLLAFMESPLTEPVTLVLLQDQGFRKFGFDHGNRRSFTDYEDNLQFRSNGAFRYFTPCFPNDFYRDQNFNPVGRYAQLPGGSRHRSRTANTSAACCTKSRWTVESLFCRESHLSLLGSSSEVPRQYLNPCGIPNYDSQSSLAVWLHIGDSLLFHHSTPYTYKYGTVDTYQQHGNDIRSRIELETPLSSHSGVQWSRDDIFRAPLGRNPMTRHGQPVVPVNLFDPQATGMPPVTLDEMSSVTLGSFQLKLVRSYSTSLR